MAVRYQVRAYSPTGSLLYDSLPVSSLSLQRRVHEVGNLEILLAQPLPISRFRDDTILEVWRQVDDNPPYLEGETIWWVKQPNLKGDTNGVELMTLKAVDLLHLLTRRIVAYDDSLTTYTEVYDLADDALKQIVRQNYGAAALDAARNLEPYLTVQGDASLGAIAGDSIARKTVLDACRGLAEASETAGAKIYFDIVRTTSPVRWELRTYRNYRGRNHSRTSGLPVVVAETRGNLSEPDLSFDFLDGVHNYVYAGGAGEAGWRQIAEAANLTAIGAGPAARTEVWVDASNVSDPAILQKVADAALARGKPRLRFTGRVLDTNATRYGYHYNYGDLITAEHKNLVIDCHVSAISLTYNRDQGEQLDIRLNGEIPLG